MIFFLNILKCLFFVLETTSFAERYETQIICRWADKFFLHCNIFIYIRHICIKEEEELIGGNYRIKKKMPLH